MLGTVSAHCSGIGVKVAQRFNMAFRDTGKTRGKDGPDWVGIHLSNSADERSNSAIRLDAFKYRWQFAR